MSLATVSCFSRYSSAILPYNTFTFLSSISSSPSTFGIHLTILVGDGFSSLIWIDEVFEFELVGELFTKFTLTNCLPISVILPLSLRGDCIIRLGLVTIERWESLSYRKLLLFSYDSCLSVRWVILGAFEGDVFSDILWGEAMKHLENC